MSDMPWFKFFPSDWLGGTRGLSALEAGVYINLLATMYERGEPLPFEPTKLARMCGATVAQFKSAIETLTSDGKIVCDDGRLWNERVEKELSERAERSSTAQKSADERWKKNRNKNNGTHDALASEAHSECNASQKPEARSQKEKEESCTKRSRISYPDDFEQFWQEYPTDPLMSKKQALAAWKRLGEEDREAARAAIQAFRSHCRSNPDYRPVHAERFLSQRRFDGFGAAPPGSARIDPDLARLAEIEAAARAKRQEGLNG